MKWTDLTAAQRNLLVHEKVMGCNEHTALSQGKRVLVFLNAVDILNDVKLSDKIPPYSESMDAAWLVVEHVGSAVLDVHKQHTLTLHRALFVGVGTEYSASYVTMPEAICIAALRAQGIEVEQ